MNGRATAAAAAMPPESASRNVASSGQLEMAAARPSRPTMFW